MANPLTHGEGVTSGAGENSTSPPQTYAAQQQAILEAQQREQRAAAAAVNAANRAASHAPAQRNMSETMDSSDFGIPFTVTPAPAQPKGRSTRKGK